MAEFVIPEFLQHHSVDEVHEIMKSILPADIDISEGSHEWNKTRPTALVVAEVCEFVLPEVIKLIFPEFSYDEFLGYHAKTRNMERLDATAATGEITITGEIGSKIPAGSLFATVSINDEPSISYRTTEDGEITDEAIVKASIRCIEEGTAGNVVKNTPFFAKDQIDGVVSAVNEEAIRFNEKLDPQYASGLLTITGKVGTVIPAGSIFSSRYSDQYPSVQYETLQEIVIPACVRVRVECTEVGSVGNTIRDTVILVGSKLTGIKAVTNEEPITGGTERESDESLQERITEYDRTQGESFVGNVADYKRWAENVDGVGAAIVIPAYDDTGLVTIIIIDANGAPATEELCESVYNYIMRPDDEESRLAPVNAYLSVIPPETLTICVKATTELEYEATLESVKANFMAALALYIPEALVDKEIKYSRIWSILSSVAGVNDHKGLKVGLKYSGENIAYGTGNIPITARQLPIIEVENLDLTTGSV